MWLQVKGPNTRSGWRFLSFNLHLYRQQMDDDPLSHPDVLTSAPLPQVHPNHGSPLIPEPRWEATMLSAALSLLFVMT